MSRLTTPETIESSPPGAQMALRAVEKSLGTIPNLFRGVGNSPAAPEGYLAAANALTQGSLDAVTRERIALVVAVNAFTNYLNEVAQTAIDFPRVGKQRQAA